MKKDNLIKYLKGQGLSEDIINNIVNMSDEKVKKPRKPRQKKPVEQKPSRKPRQKKQVEQPNDTKSFIHMSGGVKKLDKTEGVNGRLTRTEKVDIKKIKKIKKVDDGSSKEDSLTFDKKVVFKKSDRTRQPFKPKKVTCISCNDQFEINPFFYRTDWRCDECLMTKRYKK